MPPPEKRSADQLLRQIQRDDQRRARLRIYIGAAPGVGKTYAMLEEAHALKARGVDVVVAFVETYGRVDTEARVGDLEVIPRRTVPYKGAVLEEMDLDAVMVRKPAVALVDELAHTNVPGQPSRETVSGRPGAARPGHQRPHRGQYPAHRNAQRHRQPRDGRARARDRTRHLHRSRGRGDQRRRDGRGAAYPIETGQGLQA